MSKHPRWVDYDLLRIFDVIDRSGSIGAALKYLPGPMDRSTASKALTRLTEQVGYPLCQRDPFSTLPAGRRLLGKFRPLHAAVEAEIDNGRQRTTPEVRLAASPAVIQGHWPDVWDKIHGLVPGIRQDIISAPEEENFAHLESGRVDLMIGPLGGTCVPA